MALPRLPVLLVLAAVVLAGCAAPSGPPGSGGSGGHGASTSPPTPTPPAPAPNTVKALGHECNNCFEPATISVKVGEKVTWVGTTGSHTVTFRQAPSGSGEAPDSGNIDEGQKYEMTFPKAGTFAYYCRYHSWADFTKGMVGTVQVT